MDEIYGIPVQIDLGDGTLITVIFSDDYPVDAVMAQEHAEPENTEQIPGPTLQEYFTEYLQTIYQDPLVKELLQKFAAENGQIVLAPQQSIQDVRGFMGFFMPADYGVYENELPTIEIPLTMGADTPVFSEAYINSFFVEELLHAATPDDMSVNEELFVQVVAYAVHIRNFSDNPSSNVEDYIAANYLHSEGRELRYEQAYTSLFGSAEWASGNFYEVLGELDTDILAYIQEANAMAANNPGIDNTLIPDIDMFESLEEFRILMQEFMDYDGEASQFQSSLQPSNGRDEPSR